ncbi:hypothetical protein ACFQDG_09315 [Natronoarchaeum mannanilyticum]|uniref:Uncharacterized protein n=1 Tax=Natronoarchaeum mannanilyticum TaxID=926360 RepID=A0AAV3TCM6_9EURY
MADEDLYSRRRILQTGTTIATTLLTGCADPLSSNANDSVNVNKIDLSAHEDTIRLPSVWTDEDSLEDVQATLTAEIEADSKLGEAVLESNGEEYQSWNDLGRTLEQEITVPPGDLQNGENTFTLTSNRNKDSHRITKETPQTHLLNLQPANENNADSNIFTTYQPPKQIQHNQLTIDLQKLENWHDNDYENIEHQEGSQFIQSIGTDTPEDSISHQAKTRPESVRYPNEEGKSNTYGHFDYQKFSSSESVGEALDWLQTYLFNWQRNFDDPGPISTEDELYAAVLQEGLDQHTDIESHFWAFDLPEAPASTHGNGLVYDQTNNELRIMETISAPETWSPETGEQYHPLVENSNYLNPDHDAYSSWWHPLRFNGEKTGKNSLSLRDGNFYASTVLRGIATGQDEDVELTTNSAESGIAPVGNYLPDLMDKLRNWNVNDEYDEELFQEIKDQSKAYNKLRNGHENYLVGGTVENPIYAKVDQSTVEKAWNNPEETIVDYVEELDEEIYEQMVSGTASASIETTNQLLEPTSA